MTHPGCEGFRTAVLDADQTLRALSVRVAIALPLIARIVLSAAVPGEFHPRVGIARLLRSIQGGRLALRGGALLQLLDQGILGTVVAAELRRKAVLLPLLGAFSATRLGRAVTPGTPTGQEAIHSVGAYNSVSFLNLNHSFR